MTNPEININLNIVVNAVNGEVAVQTLNMQKSIEKPMEIKREDFGPGQTGKMAFELIKAGANCEFFQSDKKERCNRRATQTLDMDIFGQVEVMPMCSDTHRKLHAVRGILELKKQNLDGCLSVNGMGRA